MQEILNFGSNQKGGNSKLKAETWLLCPGDTIKVKISNYKEVIYFGLFETF